MVAIIDVPIHLVESEVGVECCWVEREVNSHNVVEFEEREMLCESFFDLEPKRETISRPKNRSFGSRFKSRSFWQERPRIILKERSLSFGNIGKGKLNDFSVTPIYVQEPVKCEDPWNAAKRGDLQALYSCNYTVDWTREDEFNSPPLYYACHSGAAVNLEVVRFLLQVYPTRLPAVLFERCRKNAINVNVVKLLEAAQANVDLNHVQLLQQEEENDQEHFGFLHEEHCDY